MAISRTLAQFSRRINKRASQLDRGLSKVLESLAVQTVSALYDATPKDTTLAASSWYASKGVSNTTKPTAPVSRGEAVSRARDAVRGVRSDGRVVISNNQDYIRRLDQGYSSQAPAGFVMRAILVARQATLNLKIFKRN